MLITLYNFIKYFAKFIIPLFLRLYYYSLFCIIIEAVRAIEPAGLFIHLQSLNM